VEVSSVNSGAVASTEAQNSILDKDDFLKLLVTQLSHQDPMEPMDNNEFIAQMTQFSSLEQLENIASGIDSNVMLTQSMNNAFSTTLIGKNVVIQGDTVDVGEDAATSCGFYAASAGTAEVTIKDTDGNTVRTLSVQSDGDGYVDVPWDLKDQNGNDVPQGSYSVSITYTGEDGVQKEVSPFITGRVTPLKFMSGNAYLTVGGREYNLAQVIEVSE